MYNIFSLSLGFSLSSINISICMSFCQILQLTFPLYCLDFGSVSLLHNAKKPGIRTEAHQYDVVSFMPLILTFLLLHPMCHHITIHHSPPNFVLNFAWWVFKMINPSGKSFYFYFFNDKI